MPILDVRVGPHRLNQAVGVDVEFMNLAASFEIEYRVAKFTLTLHFVVSAYGDVHDDIFLAVHNLKTLLNCRWYIHAHDSSPIHENVTLEVLRWEDTWH